MTASDIGIPIVVAYLIRILVPRFMGGAFPRLSLHYDLMDLAGPGISPLRLWIEATELGWLTTLRVYPDSRLEDADEIIWIEGVRVMI